MVAILTKEPEGPDFVSAIRGTGEAVISAVNVHESGMIMRSRLGPDGLTDLFDLLAALDVGIAPFEAEDAHKALAAFERYGKGVHSKSLAQLNLCDCAAYALATRLDAPLLFKGNDFVHTDVKRLR